MFQHLILTKVNLLTKPLGKITLAIEKRLT
jgi:hypothetical protein